MVYQPVMPVSKATLADDVKGNEICLHLGTLGVEGAVFNITLAFWT